MHREVLTQQADLPFRCKSSIPCYHCAYGQEPSQNPATLFPVADQRAIK
jgi:hypothetical protein